MKAFIIILILIVAGVLGYYFLRDNEVAAPIDNPITYTTPAPLGTATTTSSTSTAYMIRVTAPVVGALVASPLVVSGEARGHWYFEASFPVKILDATGKVLAVAPAQAQGEWMTTNFVPFRLSLPFATSSTATGTLVLEKDNPSGLPQNDASLRIPIRFR